MLFKFPHLGSGPDHESIREQFQPQFHPVSWPILKESMDSDQENTIYIRMAVFSCFFNIRRAIYLFYTLYIKQV